MSDWTAQQILKIGKMAKNKRKEKLSEPKSQIQECCFQAFGVRDVILRNFEFLE
jgi:hypothetical protein